MKYLCLLYADEARFPKMPKADADRWLAEYAAFTAGIRESGHYVGSNRLQPTHSATTVRVRDGKVSTTDGPFMETKEQLGGYYLIEARDLNAPMGANATRGELFVRYTPPQDGGSSIVEIGVRIGLSFFD